MTAANPNAAALLEKSGTHGRRLIAGPSRNGVAFLSEWRGKAVFNAT
jgi:hypothetical protein